MAAEVGWPPMGGSWPHNPPWPPEFPPPEWPAPSRPEPRPAPLPHWPPVPVVPVPPALPSSGSSPNVLDRLLERRVVILTGHLGADAAAAASAQLMLLDATGDEPIDVRISCPDGDLDAAVALADTIDLVGAPLRACCSGKVGGPALAPLAAAGGRRSQPHCVFVLKDPTLQLGGRADELVALAAAQQRQLDGFHARLADATGQPLDRVVADMQRGVVLGAGEAVAYGLVHEIATAGGSREPSPG